MVADGRTVGQVRWRYLGLKTEIDIANEIAASLVDLGASAIVRTRTWLWWYTSELAGTEWVSHTLPPITESEVARERARDPGAPR